MTVLDSETALLELQRPLCAVPFHLTEHLPMETTSFCKFCRVHSPQSPCLWQPLLSASVALCTHHKAPVCGNHFFLQVLLCALTTKHLSLATTSFCKCCSVHSPQSTCLWQPLSFCKCCSKHLPQSICLWRPVFSVKHLPTETSSFCKCYPVHSPQSICLWRPFCKAPAYEAPAYKDKCCSVHSPQSTCLWRKE